MHLWVALSWQQLSSLASGFPAQLIFHVYGINDPSVTSVIPADRDLNANTHKWPV